MKKYSWILLIVFFCSCGVINLQKIERSLYNPYSYKNIMKPTAARYSLIEPYYTDFMWFRWRTYDYNLLWQHYYRPRLQQRQTPRYIPRRHPNPRVREWVRHTTPRGFNPKTGTVGPTTSFSSRRANPNTKEHVNTSRKIKSNPSVNRQGRQRLPQDN